MKYIFSLLWIVWGAFALTSCDETTLQQETTLTAGWGDTLIQVYENAGKLSLPLKLSAPAPADLTVDILVKSEINMRDGIDYLIANRKVNIAKGTSSAEVTVELTDDRIVNDNRQILLEIASGQGFLREGSKSACRIEILDDESDASVAFGSPVAFFREADATYYIPVKLQGTPAGPIKITVATNDVTAITGEHYRIVEKEYLVTPDFPGIPVVLANDDVINPDRTFNIHIVSVTGAIRITAFSMCTVTIRNEDLGISVAASGAIEESPTSTRVLKIPIRLVGDPESDLKVNIEVVDGVGNAVAGQDFSLNTTSLTIPSGQDSVEIEVVALYNAAVSGDKTFRLRIASVEGHDELDLSDKTCDITLYDYDADLALGRAAYKLGNNVAKVSLTAQLSRSLRHDVVFKFNTIDGCELTPTEVKIPAGTTAAELQLILVSNPASFDLSITPMSGITLQHVVQSVNFTVNPVATLTRTNWTVTADSEEPAGSGGDALMMLDGNEDTYWHSSWSQGFKPLPYHLVFDMQKTYGISEIKISRAKRTGMYGCELFISKDKITWTSVGRLEFPGSIISPWNGQTLTIDIYNEGRYLQVLVDKIRTEQNNPAQIAEVAVQGWLIE